MPAVSSLALGFSIVVSAGSLLFQAVPATAWLDRPLEGWNRAGSALARPRAVPNPDDDFKKRCELETRRDTAAERTLADAGWVPFLFAGRQLVRGDLEVIGGLSNSDGMCRPSGFNAFVFIAGVFAGTLSPQDMDSRLDASLNSVRIVGDDVISAEFVRYRPEDPLCCPSSHVTVRYRLDRTGAKPVVVPIEVRTTRG
jgi:hypothetical protein